MKTDIPSKPIKDEIISSLKNKNIKVAYDKCESVMAAGTVKHIDIINEELIISFTSGQTLNLLMPFDIRKDDNKVVLDYTVKSFKSKLCIECKANLPELVDNILVKEQPNIKKSKFLDTKIIITTV